MPRVSPIIVRKALEEYGRRAARRRRLDLERLTFGGQQAFVTDAAPYVAASCSRQCGKTWGIALKLLDKALDWRGTTSLYLTNTRPQARAIMWPVLRRVDTDLELGGRFHEVRLTYTLPNGSVIQLGGCNDEIEIERYRGPQYPLVVIDEAQSIRPFIRYLINEILRPGQAKYGAAGQIMITGTPNAARTGLLYDVATGAEEGWSVHHWTIRDNPHIPDVEAFIADILRRRGLSTDDPAYLREYCGQWVRDAQAQVYRIGPDNLVDAFPAEPSDWRYVLGIDFGFVGVTAFVVLAYSTSAGRIVVAESYQTRPPEGETMMRPEHVAEHIGRLEERYDFAGIVGDPGGLGKAFIDDLRRRWRIPIEAAEKTRKQSAVEWFNGDCRLGRVLVVEPRNRDLLHDAAHLQYDFSRVDDTRHGGHVSRFDLLIDTRTPDHLTDAMTYGYRLCRHYLRDDDEGAAHPPVGSPEYEAWAEEQQLEEELEKARRDDWLDGDGLPDVEPFGFGL